MGNEVEWDVRWSGTERAWAGGAPIRGESASLWLLVLEGQVRLDSFGERRTLAPGDAAYLRHAGAHRIEAIVDSRLQLADLRLRGPADLPEPLVARGFADRQSGVVALLDRCPVRAERPNGRRAVRVAYGQLLGSAMLTESLPVDQAPSADADADAALRTVVRAVLAEPEREWTLPLLARTALVGRSVLVDRFRTTMGTTAMRFVRRTRVEKATELLRDPSRSVTAVSFAVGYGSAEAFVRAFRAEMGTSPGRWRQDVAENTLREVDPNAGGALGAAAMAPAGRAAPSLP